MWDNGHAGQDQLTFLNLTLLALGCGIIAASLFRVPWLPVAGCCAVACVLALLAWRQRSTLTWLCLLLLFLGVGWGRMAAVMTPRADDLAALEGEAVEIGGVLLEPARLSVDAEGVRHVRYLVELQTRQVDGRAQAQTGRVYVYATERGGREKEGQTSFCSARAQVGDSLQVRGYVALLRGYGNPGSYNPYWAAAAQDITAVVRAGSHGVRLEQTGQEPAGLLRLRRWAAAVRAHYLQGMERVMPQTDAAAIFAMLFGGYEGIRPELLAAFTTTGIVHILSVSGSHITLLAGTLARLGALLRLRRGLVAIFVIAAVILYGILAGGVPPVVRSGVMGIMSFLALVWGRERDARRLLTLTCLCMLLYEPRYLFDLSFQLSFGATAGLLYLAPRVTELLLRVPQLPRALALSTGVTCGAQLFVLPLIAWYFHVVSLSSFPANLLAVPPVETIIMLGLLAGLIGFVLPVLAGVIYVLDSLLLGFVYELTRLLALLPGSKIYLPAFGWGSCALYYLGLTLCLQQKERREAVLLQLQGWKPFLAGLLSTLLLGYGAYTLTRPAELQAHFPDVGQGDAALFITPHGRAFMIDTGGTRDGRFDVGTRVDVPYLLHYGVHRLDAIFLTHVHEDHAGGAGGILRTLPVGPLICAHEGMNAYNKVLQLSAAEQERTQLVEAQAGMVYQLDGVKIEVLFSPETAATTGGHSSRGQETGNELSNVFRVSYGQASFLITGDLVRAQELELLQQASPQAVVLKVAHHGSKTSSSPEFLQAVAPRWSVISAGRGNTFGHPHQQTLDALEACGSEVLRTDRDGAIVFRTDGERMRVEKFRE